MATYQKRGTSYRAIIRTGGVSESKTFAKKGEAVAWATAREAEIHAGTTGTVPNKTFGELVAKYVEDVSPLKEGSRWEEIRGKSFQKDELANIRLSVLNKTHISAWRDRRLAVVSAGTVLREWNFLSAVCTKAINDWGWLHKHPMSGVQRPKEPEHRDRLISPDEIERIKISTGYHDGTLAGVSQRVGAAFLFAIETGMRAGEIAELLKEDLFLDKRYLKVQRGKTQAARRDVPLSKEAVRILKQLPMEKTVFDLKSASIDALFRKARDAAMVTDLHFHDARHEAITRLSKKLDILALARSIGHRDLKMLMRYYNESGAELAKLL